MSSKWWSKILGSGAWTILGKFIKRQINFRKLPTKA